MVANHSHPDTSMGWFNSLVAQAASTATTAATSLSFPFIISIIRVPNRVSTTLVVVVVIVIVIAYLQFLVS